MRFLARRVRSRLHPRQLGLIARVDSPLLGTVYVHWDSGAEQLCFLSDLQVLR